MNALVTRDSKQCFQICWNSKDLKIFQVELQNSKLFLKKKTSKYQFSGGVYAHALTVRADCAFKENVPGLALKSP